MTFPVPDNENQRFTYVEETQLLDSEPEPVFDELVQLAAKICDAPIAMVTLLDKSRAFVKAGYGIDATEVPRSDAFCTIAILNPSELLEIPDTQADKHWRETALVTNEPHVRFYAGFPLTTREGLSLGTLCVASPLPKCLLDWQREALGVLARQVTNQIEMRTMLRKHIEYENALELYRQELENTLRKLS